MKKKLVVGGCSITHGAETVDGFMHPDNVQYSYSHHLSTMMGVDLVNLALSGSSNDDIFHALIEEIDKHAPEHIHSVFAAWTSIHRLHWTNKGRHWFFLPAWASSMEDLMQWQPHQHPDTRAFITADSPEILETLQAQHRFFVDNYLDDTQFLKKRLTNLKSALQSHCDARSIKLVQVDIINHCSRGNHPNRDDHLELAHKFYQQFYSMDQR